MPKRPETPAIVRAWKRAALLRYLTVKPSDVDYVEPKRNG